MDNQDELIHEFLNHLINSPVDPGEVHSCPKCRGKIHVWFAAYKRGEYDLLGVTLQCESCDLQMAVDYGMASPSWVQTG
jgi:hypothetical protein